MARAAGRTKPRTKSGKTPPLADNQVTLDTALELAQRHHQLGNLMLAERTYRDILQAVPGHYPSVHHLGVVLYQRGNVPESLHYLKLATEAAPKDPVCWSNYGAILSEARQYAEALPALQKAVKLRPDYPEGYNNLSNTLWLLDRFPEAEKAARRAAELRPKYQDALLNLGNALVSQGKKEEAVTIWKKIVKTDPKHSKALNNIGNALRDLGRIGESETYCRRAIEANAANPEAWNNLANALLDQGKPGEAEECYRKATSLRPDYVQAHNNLAIALMHLQRHEEALTAVRYAVSFRPDYPEALSNMSILLRELGQYHEAEMAARRAIHLSPKPEYYIDLADVLFMEERLDEANAALEEATKLAPDSRKTWQKLAGVLERLNKPDEALDALDKAIAMSPEMPDLWVRRAQICHISNRIPEAREALDTAMKLKADNPAAIGMLADLQQTLGDMKESEKTLRRALKINDNLPSLYFSLAKVAKLKKTGRDFKKMLELDKKSDRMPRLQAASLHFALFDAWEQFGDHAKAFEHLKKGNDLKRSTVPFKSEQITHNHDAVKKINNRKALAALRGKGYTGRGADIPVFIVGMPRSGTTLTEQIVSSHPQVFGAGELSLFNDILKDMARLTPENAAQAGRLYVERAKKLDPSGKALRITDKMPGNYLRIPEIVSALPDAKIIHCRRDPVATCLSCYQQLFARGQYWSYTLEELAIQYRAYEDLMNHWRKLLPGRFIDVDYEDTVSDFENQARRLIDFVGLEWDEACLKPHKQKRAVLTASKAQVIKPVYTSSVAGWKKYAKELRPLVKALGNGGKKIVPPPQKPAKKSAQKSTLKNGRKPGRKSAPKPVSKGKKAAPRKRARR